MQETQNLTNQQKLEHLKKGCQFRHNGSQSTYSTEPTSLDIGFWLLRNNSYLAIVDETMIGSAIHVKIDMFGVTNTYPLDLTLVEIL